MKNVKMLNDVLENERNLLWPTVKTNQ